MRVVLSLVILAAIVDMRTLQWIQDPFYMTVPQLITAAGYPNEDHQVTTEDGYILQMHRIPAGRQPERKTDQHSKRKKAILLVHGLHGGSGDFIIMGPKRSLAYLLADAGYDVWLGNLRSSVYGSHVYYTRENPVFWKFSFHEHGKYDAPAMIDTILNVTGLPKVMYIGYSMGTTTFFTMMSERPEYNEKVLNFVALAPAVYLDNIRPLSTMLFRDFKVTDSMRKFGVMDVNFGSNILNMAVGNICNLQEPKLDICMHLIFTIIGEDYEQCDWDMLPIILRRLQPASWRQLEHFGKISMTGQFTTWEGGLWSYNRTYNLSNVKVPVTLLYGKNDRLTDKWQIMRLARQLQQIGVLESVRPATWWPRFNHIDFIYARDIGVLLNKPLVQSVTSLFNKYAPAN